MSYNGWYNYQTWVTKLWLDNEETSYIDVTNAARTISNKYDLAAWIEGYVDGYYIPETSGLASDLLRSALAEVDWAEIAEAYLEE